jgi:hypothetical protein
MMPGCDPGAVAAGPREYSSQSGRQESNLPVNRVSDGCLAARSPARFSTPQTDRQPHPLCPGAFPIQSVQGDLNPRIHHGKVAGCRVTSWTRSPQSARRESNPPCRFGGPEPRPLGHGHTSFSGRRGSRTLKGVFGLAPVRAGCHRQLACPSVVDVGPRKKNQVSRDTWPEGTRETSPWGDYDRVRTAAHADSHFTVIGSPGCHLLLAS